MVDTKAVSIRLPLDLLNELNSYATDKGMVRGGDANIGGAIIAILREHFGQSDNVKLVSDNVDIESIVNIAIAKQLNVPIAPLLAKIDSLESTIGSQDDKIAALEAIVVGLPTTFISTEQVEAIFNRAIKPLLEALDNTRSETITHANFTQALTSESDERNVEEVDGSSLESDALPIIEAITNIAAPVTENQFVEVTSESVETIAAPVIQTPLPDATLPDAIAATVNPILTRPEALAIAQNFGFLGKGQNLYAWSKAALTSKSDEAKKANSEKLAAVGLVAAFNSENKPAWKIKTLS